MARTYVQDRTKKRRVSVWQDDGRTASAHAAQWCVCGYCWGPVVERYDEELKRWYASCSNELHRGFHHFVFVERTKSAHALEVLEVKHFYSRTPLAAALGFEPPLTGDALQARLKQNKQVLGQSDLNLGANINE